MRHTDRDTFGEVMRDAYQAIGQGQPYTEGGLDLMFAAMQDLSLQQVQMALVNHMNDKVNGKWRPNASLIRDQLAKNTPAVWVGADEAWGTAPKLESDSGLCNQVVAGALAVAQSLIDSGDMVAARRTFIEAYNARVEKAKNHPDPAQRVPITFVSAGNQPERYDDAQGERQMLLERAQKAGLLAAPQVAAAPMLPPVKRTGPKPDFKALLLTLKPKELPPPEAQDYAK